MAEHLETSLEVDDGAPSAEAEVLGPGSSIGQYEIIRELGRGAMGVVYAARDTRLGRRVAIKFVHQASGEVAQRFLIEARALARCEHPNIVVIHAVDDYDGLPYLVLEFLEGHSLRVLLEAAPRLPASRVVELALPCARALACAHGAEIVHRDLKPENVFLTTAGQIKVLDFGIAKAVGDDRASTQRLTAKHSLLGTLTYMSPEQMSNEGVDARSDVWALGIMLFEMLAGRHPIEPLTTEALFTNAVSDDPMPTLASVAPDVPARLARLVDRCLVKDRTKRPASAEVERELEELLPGRRVRKLGENESPYPGLAAFQEADAGRFFGRDSEIARTVARVRELPMFGVIGPSGAGKSSFVRAGVAPALKASGERWDIVSLRPGRSPLHALTSVVLRATASVAGDAPTSGVRGNLMQKLRSEPGYLGALLRGHARRTRQHVLVFVDQFEELFTLAADVEERQAFTAALAGAADDPSAPVRVIVAMRSDFLDRLVDHGTFVEELSRGLQLLSTPDRAGLRDALEQPLALDGYAFERDAIVEDMLDALEGTSGALPLLQFCAAKLWDGRDTQRKQITLASYQAIGGVSGALATHADEVIARLDTNAQRIARRILRALVTPERTRAVVEFADLLALAPQGADATRVIDQLVAARLVVVQKHGQTGGGTAELVHESLIDRWPMLRRWIDEDQEDAAYVAQIGAAAKQWELRGRAPGLLWRGAEAAESMRWVAARPRELPARDRAFLDAVGALGRRGARRRRRIAIGAFVALSAIAAAAIVGVIQVDAAREEALRNASAAAHNSELWRQAASARDEEERQKRLAQARRDDAEREANDATARAAREQQEAAARSAAAERERLAAEREKHELELAVQQTATLSREALQKKNLELEAALHEARAAQERAEKAVADAHKAEAAAQKSAADAEQSKRQLEKALEAERQRVKQLDEEKRKLSTQLKE